MEREPQAEPALPKARRAARLERPSQGASPALLGTSPASADGSMVRVLCVDDHAVLVEGLRAQFAIEGRIQVAGRLPSTDRLLEEVDRLKPDVVILDIELPGPDVFEMADRMHRANPLLRCVFLSAHVRDGYLAAAYKCGASGYFAKGDDLEVIVAGLMHVVRSAAGTFVMGTKVREHCQASRSAGAVEMCSGAPREERVEPVTPLDMLSAREIEILRLIGRGLSRVQIAAELSRSPRTVDGHQDRILKKLGLDCRADLIRFAIREGLAEA